MTDKSQYNSKKTTNTKKAGKIIFNILFYIVMLFFIIVLVFSLVQRLSGKDVYPFFGYRGMIVESGSMSFKCEENKEFLEGHDEQMQIRDLVFTRKLKEGETPEVYDIVTFKMGEATVIHRVVEIYTDPTTGKTMYVTQGDARPERDAPKSLDQITGIYVGSLGQFGVFIDFMQSSFGIIAIIVCVAILLIAKVIMNYVRETSKKEKEENAEKNEDNEEQEKDTNAIDTSSSKPDKGKNNEPIANKNTDTEETADNKTDQQKVEEESTPEEIMSVSEGNAKSFEKL